MVVGRGDGGTPKLLHVIKIIAVDGANRVAGVLVRPCPIRGRSRSVSWEAKSFVSFASLSWVQPHTTHL